MATWITHLRIADRLLDRFPDLSPVEFIVGSLAPDSGVPSADGRSFLPDTTVSHFRSGPEKANPEAFLRKYLPETRRGSLEPRQLGFYLGYLVHLMTDVLWSRKVVLPALAEAGALAEPEREAFLKLCKADWYALDFKYLRDHPGFRAFRVYLGAVGFPNVYMEEFSEQAFDQRRQYITDFYLSAAVDPDREYRFLTQQQLDMFVEDTVQTLHRWLSENIF